MRAEPRRPARRKVPRAPISPLTGAVMAKERGTSPVEMNQSRLDTRPSSALGTSRCFTVSHTTVPAASKALNRTLISMACQTAPTNA